MSTMEYYRNFYFSINLLFFVGNIVSESVTIKHYDCWKPKGSSPCSINSVSIDPCPEAKQEPLKPCIFKRGINASIAFEYTPNFSAINIFGQAHKSDLLQDLPLVSMDIHACKYTKCPLEPGVPNVYKYSLPIEKDYPEGPFTVKWKLWNEKNPIEESCCMKFKIILT